MKLNKLLTLYPCIMQTLFDWTHLLILLFTAFSHFLRILPLHLYLMGSHNKDVFNLAFFKRRGIVAGILATPTMQSLGSTEVDFQVVWLSRQVRNKPKWLRSSRYAYSISTVQRRISNKECLLFAYEIIRHVLRWSLTRRKLPSNKVFLWME